MREMGNAYKISVKQQLGNVKNNIEINLRESG
jgi:hypothetical protein